MIDGNVLAFGEGKPEQAMRGVERGRDHLVELEIGHDLGLIEIITRFPQFLGVVAPVPWLQREVAAFFRDQGLKRIALFQRAGARRLPHLLQQMPRIGRRLGHRVGQLVVGEGLVAEQSRALGPQCDHF